MLREILLVRAIEESDRTGALLPAADREHATRDALREARRTPAEVSADGSAMAAVLAARAGRLLGPLRDRHPIVAELLGRAAWPGWAAALLLATAFASGLGLSAMSGARRIDILAVPFLGVVGWNLLVYAALLLGWLHRRVAARGAPPAARGGWTTRVLARRLAPLLKQTARVDTALGEAVRRFAADWAAAEAPRLAARLRVAIHLGAAAVAVGLVVGLYLRGLVLRYEAGWDSTFLDAGQVHRLIDALFGPVADWAGITLPRSTAEVAALRWTPGGGGGDAAPWIHLIALCLTLVVILPRLLLAGLAALRLALAGRRPRLAEPVLAYGRRVLGAPPGAGAAAVLAIGYAYEPDEASRARLAPRIAAGAGVDAGPRWLGAFPYGAETALAAALERAAHLPQDALTLVFSLASTPEAENHGRAIALAREHCRRVRPQPRLQVLVDETPYAARLGGAAAAGGRLDERRRLWREFVAASGADAVFAAPDAVP